MIWPFGDLKKNHYRVILADPAWNFVSGPSRNPRNHYQCMKLADIKALPVSDLAHPDGARVLMWVTFPFLEKGFEVLKSWGCRYSTGRVWVKLWLNAPMTPMTLESFARGTGYEVIGNPELVLHAKYGVPDRAGNKKPSGLIFANRRQHSRKPDSVREEYAQLYRGPRCELFARSTDSSYESWGNETTKFSEAA
jgi:N6-adenosine-specific RNA methylase IME4